MYSTWNVSARQRMMARPKNQTCIVFHRKTSQEVLRIKILHITGSTLQKYFTSQEVFHIKILHFTTSIFYAKIHDKCVMTVFHHQIIFIAK